MSTLNSPSADSLPFPPVPEVRNPEATPRGIAAELRRILAESEIYWAAYDTHAFFHRPAPEVWAPVDQVRHLTKGVAAVMKGLRFPRPVLFLLFGPARRPSRTIATLETDYDAVLAAGGKAGRFAPRALAPHEVSDERRQQTMTRHSAAVAELASAIERWPALALDRYRLPHLLLGKLTVREMLLFTLIHNVHHVRVAERRRVYTNPAIIDH